MPAAVRAAGIARKWEGERRRPADGVLTRDQPRQARSVASLQGAARPLRCCLTPMMYDSISRAANRESSFNVVQ